MKTISIIIPCYNEKANIKLIYDEIKEVLTKVELSYKFIFIDDGSTDETLKKIKEIAINDNVTYISFSRNFGKEAAMYAGLKKVTTDYALIIDADLQHDPNNIIQMYNIIVNEGYDFVATKRVKRDDASYLKKWGAILFYKIMNRFSDISIQDGLQDYCLMTKQVVTAITSLNEYNRFTKGIYNWIGFNKKIIEVKNKPRQHGKTTWSFNGLIKYALDGLTSFSTTPLKLTIISGLITALICLSYLIFVFFKTIIIGEVVKGFPTLVILILFLGSIQLISLGIIGEYLSKMYLETKKRPIYIVKEEKND